MFSPHTLPPPSTSFSHEHRPLRLTSETARSYPQGGCHYQQLQTPCMCQNFQHDRSAPGNLCDCGHSACYHSQTPDAGKVPAERSLSALKDQVKGLEDIILREKFIREDWLVSQREACENEMHLLRKALASAHGNGIEVKQALLTVETKLDRYHREHGKLRAQVEAMDRIGIALEKRVTCMEATTTRKRKASGSVDTADMTSPKSTDVSSHSVTPPASCTRSPHGSSPAHAANNAEASPEASRPCHAPSGVVVDSGRIVLNTEHQHPEDRGEPRSSGFLSINLTERVRRERPLQCYLPIHAQSLSASSGGRTPSGTAWEIPPPHRSKAASLSLPALVCHDSELARKTGKRAKNFMALDILANATVARPLMH